MQSYVPYALEPEGIMRSTVIIQNYKFRVMCQTKYLNEYDTDTPSHPPTQHVIHSLTSPELSRCVAGNRMFSFEEDANNFYLPQLINMYIHMRDVAEAIHPYIVHR